MAFDPAPLNSMSRTGHYMVQRLPQLDVFDRLLGCGTPAFGFPAVDPLGDAFANVFAVQIKRDLARPLERFETFNHGREFHAVIGGTQFAAKEFVDMLARLQANAPASRTRVALASPIGMDNNVIQEISFEAVRPLIGESDLAKGTAVAAGDRTVRQRRPSSQRLPDTRLVATIK